MSLTSNGLAKSLEQNTALQGLPTILSHQRIPSLFFFLSWMTVTGWKWQVLVRYFLTSGSLWAPQALELKCWKNFWAPHVMRWLPGILHAASLPSILQMWFAHYILLLSLKIQAPWVRMFTYEYDWAMFSF